MELLALSGAQSERKALMANAVTNLDGFDWPNTDPEARGFEKLS